MRGAEDVLGKALLFGGEPAWGEASSRTMVKPADRGGREAELCAVARFEMRKLRFEE